MRFILCLLFFIICSFSAYAEISESDKKILTPEEIVLKKKFERDKSMQIKPFSIVKKEYDDYAAADDQAKEIWKICLNSNKRSISMTYQKNIYKNVELDNSIQDIEIEHIGCDMSHINLVTKKEVHGDGNGGNHISHFLIKIGQNNFYQLDEDNTHNKFFISNGKLYSVWYQCCTLDGSFSNYNLSDGATINYNVVFEPFVDDYLASDGKTFLNRQKTENNSIQSNQGGRL